MKDFTFRNPVEAVFGEGVFDALGDLCTGRNVMLLFGRASAKENGTYRQVRQAVEKTAASCCDVGGIAICTYDGIAQATDFARSQNIDAVVGLGGAAVMDTAKAVAFCAMHDDYDAYLTHEKDQLGETRLKLALIPTYPSTGSEANGTSDIMGYAGSINKVYADYALLYPPFTYSMDKRSTTFSTMVMLAQTGYRYFTDGNPISRGCTAASLRAVLGAFEVLMGDPHNYDARGTMLWASFLETSGLLGLSMEGNWTYSIFSANGLCRFTLDTSYREGLAVMLPRWLVWAASHHPGPVHDFLVNVLGANPDSGFQAALRFGYEKLLDICRRGGLSLTLEAYGPMPDDSAIESAIAKVSSREFSNEEYKAMLKACYDEDFPSLS